MTRQDREMSTVMACIMIAIQNHSTVTDEHINKALDTTERVCNISDERYKKTLTPDELERYERNGY